MLELAFPAFVDQSFILQGIDIVTEGKRHNVCFQPFKHRTALRSGTAMGLLNRNLLAGLLLPISCERFVVILVQLTCRVIGDVQQFHRIFGRRFGGFSRSRSTGCRI
ncbi:hypothetical protein D3C73_1370570 [compost metagenome]